MKWYIYVTKPANIIGGTSDIGIFDRATSKTGVEINYFPKPDSNEMVKAIRLNKGASIPTIWSPLLGLKANTNYVVEFDYWSDADNVRFDVDLFPDNLPQVYPVARKTVQSFRWELSSPSAYMKTSNLRFFNDTAATNPENIYITNIRLYETNSNADNIVGGSTAIGVFKIGQMTGASAVDVVHPQTGNTVSAIRLNAGASIPTARTPQMKLKAHTDYIVEFDYWADVDIVKFDVDFSPDDLPQVYPVAEKDVQHYKWKLNSSSENMKAVLFRFFNDTVQINPANIYITNIKLYEANKVAETSKEYFYDPGSHGDTLLMMPNLFIYYDNIGVNNDDQSGFWLPRKLKNALISILKQLCKDWRDNTASNIIRVIGAVAKMFSGIIGGFLGQAGLGKIQDYLDAVGKFLGYEAAFDRTWLGKSIDALITVAENKRASIINNW